MTSEIREVNMGFNRMARELAKLEEVLNILRTKRAAQLDEVLKPLQETVTKDAGEKAQAEALRVQNAALAQNKDVLELRRIEVDKVKAEKWNGALPQAIYAGAPIPFMNVGK